MSTQKTKWGKRIAIVMAFALTVASVPGADAQAAKKAKLSTKKLTIKVGKKKTIKIKNKVKKAKYTFKVKKASIAKVSKKGVVTAKKAGSTTITVKEKLGKKTRKVGNVKVTVKKNTVTKKQPTTAPSATVTPTTAATATPTAPAGQGGASEPTKAPDTDEPTLGPPTQEPGTPGPTKTPKPTPTVKPQPTPDTYVPKGNGWQKLDLSQWSGGSDNYLETGGQIVLSEVELETVPIPTSLENIGDKIEVLIRGSVPTGSDGFRYWLSNEGGATMTTMGHYSNFGEGVEDPRNADDPKADLDQSAFKAGDFEVQRVLEHINKDGSDDIIATRLLLKGPSYGTTLDGIIITGIWVRYGDDIGQNPGVDTPNVDTPNTDTPNADTSEVTKPENKSYTVDFAKGYRQDPDNDVNPTVANGVITANFTGGYEGFHYILPDEADMKNANFKYVTVTYKNPGDDLSFYLYNGDTDLKDPDISRGCTTKQDETEAGSLPMTNEEKTVTFSWDGNTVRGFQVFSWQKTTKLEISSVVFSEKEPGTGENDPGEVAWTAVPLTD